MSERQPPAPETIYTYMLNDRSLYDWHVFLTHDKETVRDNGHLMTMGSRYGHTSRTAAWFAIAAEVVMVHANGASDSPEESMDWLMGLCVNDSDDIEEMVREYDWVLPEDLKEQLDWSRIEWQP